MGNVLSKTVKNLYEEIDYLNNIPLDKGENLKYNINHATQFLGMLVKNNVHGTENNVVCRSSVNSNESITLYLYINNILKNSIVFENNNEFSLMNMMSDRKENNKSKYTILKEEDYLRHFKNIIEELNRREKFNV